LQSHEDLARKLQVNDWDNKTFVVLFLLPVEGYNSMNYVSNMLVCPCRRSWREIERHQVL